MIKLVLLDSNYTIEDYSIIKNNRESLLNQMSVSSGCSINSIRKWLLYFEQYHGEYAWEYHPFFWRNVLAESMQEVRYDDLEAIYAEFIEYYRKHISIYEDVIPFLQTISGKYKIGLVANGNAKRVNTLIEKYDLNRFFDVVVISGETPYKKPDKFMFEYAMHRVGCTSSETIMIGDRFDTDILGAKAAGLIPILIQRDGVTRKSPGPSAVPCFSIHSLSEVLRILDRFNTLTPYQVSIGSRSSEKVIRSAVILAGGNGSRLGQLGEEYQKCMLDVGGFPLLHFTVNSLKSAGCENIVIVVNHLAKQIIDYFGSGDKYGVSITYIEGSFVSTLDALYAALPQLDDEFYYCHGNIVFPERLLEELWYKYTDTDRNVMTMVDTPLTINHAKALMANNGKIKKIVKGDKPSREYLTFLGLAVYKKDTFTATKMHKYEAMTEELLITAIDNGLEVEGYILNGSFYHIENQQDYDLIKSLAFWEVNFS